MFLYIRYIQSHYSRLICTHTAPDEMCRILCNVWGVSVFQNTLKLWEMWPPLFPPSSLSLELPTLSRTLRGSLAQLEKLCWNHKLISQHRKNWEKKSVSQVTTPTRLVPTILNKCFQKAGHTLYVRGTRFISAQVFFFIFLKNDCYRWWPYDTVQYHLELNHLFNNDGKFQISR